MAKLAATPVEIEWPRYVLERAAEVPPPDCRVVAGSTPVVSFGHPLNAEMATLGINPSSGEFLDRDKHLLRGSKRRLATLESLGAVQYEDLHPEHAAKIVDECASYFDRRPYYWFKVLDGILSAALGVSYFDKTACHLDVVQWATDPVWRKLDDAVKSRLLSADRGFLERQLRHERYQVVVVAGRTAMGRVERAGLVKWKSVARLKQAPAATFAVGDTASPRFMGWSCNLQSQPGARRHISGLTKLLRKHALEPVGGRYMLEDEPALAKGTHFRTRQELLDALQRWLDSTDEETIGDAERFRRAPWISFESSAGIVDLNADTNRRAIERTLRHVRSYPGERWHVIENRKGNINKVVFSLEDTHEGWYAYLRKAVPEPTTL